MKQEVVPTSPKSPHASERAPRQAEAKAHPHLIFAVIMATLLFGFGAGFFGVLVAMNIPPDLPVLGQLNVINLINAEREEVLLSGRQRERSLIKQAPQVVDQVAILASARPTIEAPATLLGNATILTSDGWLATATAILPAAEEPAQPVVILPDGSTADVKQRIDDSFTGISFLRVEATSLPIVNFDRSQTIPVGQLISVIEKDLGSYVVFEQRAAGEQSRSNAVRTTSTLTQYTLLDDGSQQNRLGSPAFTSNGDLIGIITASGVMVQSSLLDGALQSIISQGVIARSDRALSYLNVARLTDEEKTAKQLPEQGIVITAIPEGEMQLQAGDLISSINSALVDENVDLGVVFHSRPSGSSLFFTIQRLRPEPAEGESAREEITVEYAL